MTRPRFGALLVLVLLIAPACIFASSHTAEKQATTVPTELRIGIRPPSTLDPVMGANPSDLLVARQIFEPLVGFDPETEALVPLLASSWEALDGGRAFRFHLRPQARFQDGTAVTAADVAFSLNRLAQKATNSSLAHLLSPVAGFGQVHDTGEGKQLSGVVVEDPATIRINLDNAWYEFPYVLTDPATAPVPAAKFQPDPAGFMRHPIGAGPYALGPASSLPGDLVLERWPGYWGPAPPVATARFVTTGGPSTAFADLSAGRLDISEVPPESMSSALSTFGSRGFTPLAAEIYLGFNLADPALADVRIRRAVSLAIDRQAIAQKIYGDILVPADGMIPRGLPGHTDLACGTTCSHDLARAKALVQQASGTARPEIDYDYPAGAPNDAVVSELRAELSAAGINLVAKPHTANDFLSLLHGNGQHMFMLIWVADYPLTDWFLTPLFSPKSPDNQSGYHSAQVDSLINTARSTTGTATVLDAYKQVEQKVLADMPVVPIGFFRNHYAATSRVQGFYVDVMGGFDVSRLSLSPS